MSESTVMATDIQQVKEKIREVIRHAAQERMILHSRHDDIELHECNGGHSGEPGEMYSAGQVLGNQMALILVTGEAVRITLKFHFSSQVIKKIAYPVYGVAAPELLSQKQASDFVKELCNLTAGYIVQIFEEVGMPLGISLPLCARGFCELFADYEETDDPIIRCKDQWSLSCQGAEAESLKIYGTTMTEILDVAALAKITEFQVPAVGEDEDEGEIDFL